jgi:hypothetical protein
VVVRDTTIVWGQGNNIFGFECIVVVVAASPSDGEACSATWNRYFKVFDLNFLIHTHRKIRSSLLYHVAIGRTA